MIRTILWDVDNTLLNFKKSENYALKKCLADVGVTADDAMVERYSLLNDSFWKRLERGELSRSETLLGRFRSFFEAEELPCPDLEKFNSAYQQALGDVVYPNDDCVHLCNELGEYTKQYVVSNGTSAAQERKLRRSGLYYVMNGIFISEDIGIEKPNAEFFDIILAMAGIVDRSEVVIIGDSLTGDMRGGNNAGIACWWYNPAGLANTEGVRIDREIKDLHEVLDYFVEAYSDND